MPYQNEVVKVRKIRISYSSRQEKGLRLQLGFKLIPVIDMNIPAATYLPYADYDTGTKIVFNSYDRFLLSYSK